MRRIAKRAAPALIAAALVLGASLILTPLATKVWTQRWVPAADRVHFSYLLVPALVLAGLMLHLAVSVLMSRTVRRGRGRSLRRAWPLVPQPGRAPMTVHALGDDKRTCRVCEQPFPCSGWLARTRAEVHPMVWPQTVETYRDAGLPADAIARMQTALMGEMG